VSGWVDGWVHVACVEEKVCVLRACVCLRERVNEMCCSNRELNFPNLRHTLQELPPTPTLQNTNTHTYIHTFTQA